MIRQRDGGKGGGEKGWEGNLKREVRKKGKWEICGRLTGTHQLVLNKI